MKRAFFIFFFFANAFSYQFKVGVSSENVRVFDVFDYVVEFQWNSSEDVSGVDFTEKDSFDDFEIISYQDEQRQDFREEGKVDFIKIQTYRLHPKKVGDYVVKAPKAQIFKKDASEGETLNGEEKQIKVLDGLNYQSLFRYGLIFLIGALFVLFIFWLGYHFVRRKKNARKEAFEKEVSERYRADLKARFSNDLMKKALVLRDFLEENKMKAKEAKVDFYDKRFWQLINESEIEKMTEGELSRYIEEIEKKMKG